MAKATKGSCNHCGAVVPLNESESLINYGAVIKQCPNCGKFFFDRRVKELYVTGVNKDDRKLIKEASLSLLFIGIFCTAALILLIFLFSDGPVGGRYRVSIGGILAIILGPVFLLFGIVSVITDMTSYKKRLAFLDQEKARSCQRCQNPEYLKQAREFSVLQEKLERLNK